MPFPICHSTTCPTQMSSVFVPSPNPHHVQAQHDLTHALFHEPFTVRIEQMLHEVSVVVREEFDAACATFVLTDFVHADNARQYRAWLMAYRTLRECARQTYGQYRILFAVYHATKTFHAHGGRTSDTRKLRNVLLWLYTQKLKPEWTVAWV